MPVDPVAALSGTLLNVINAEFAYDNITAYSDKLHESMGLNGIKVGVSPISTRPKPGNSAVQEILLLVQFYGLWDKMVNPDQQVDPTIITGYFSRFQAAVEANQDAVAGTNAVWFYEIIDCQFPDDPTGNKTRFEATVRGYGDNLALVARL